MGVTDFSPCHRRLLSALSTGALLGALSLALGGCIEIQWNLDESMGEDEPDDVLEEPDLREGTLYLPTGEQIALRYEVIDGRAFWGDDVLLGSADGASSGFRSATLASSLWPDATIVYRLDASLPNDKVARMLEVMDDWHEKTGLSFEEAPSYATGGFVRVQASEDGCYAALGYPGPAFEGVLNMGPDCSSRRTWRHELGHTIGLMHEQARSDRDQHVDIFWDNIPPEEHFNFDTYLARSIPGVDRGAYDHDSLMHYSSWSFAIDSSQTTIVTKSGGLIDHHADWPISEGDAAAVIAMYGLPVPGGTAEPEPEPEPEPLGGGSCEGSCGSSVVDDSGAECWCDDLCEGLGDCCTDMQDVCAAEPEPPTETSSCSGHCGEPQSQGECYCDDACGLYGDCCEDYADECVATASASASCEGHCGSDEAVDGCWCDDLCEWMGDCCEDYGPACG